jgi:hypothetical protein
LEKYIFPVIFVADLIQKSPQSGPGMQLYLTHNKIVINLSGGLPLFFRGFSLLIFTKLLLFLDICKQFAKKMQKNHFYFDISKKNIILLKANT